LQGGQKWPLFFMLKSPEVIW